MESNKHSLHYSCCSVRNKIWVEKQMHNLFRAVGTPYKMSDILRTYGTLHIKYLIFTHIKSLTG